MLSLLGVGWWLSRFDHDWDPAGHGLQWPGGDSAVEQLNPDVVLMDLRMPHGDRVEATRRISQTDTDAKVVVLTTYADDHSVIQALRAGACGFLTKDATNPQIAAALQAAKRGESAIDPAVQHHLVKAIARTAPLQWNPPAQVQLPDGLTRGKRPCSL